MAENGKCLVCQIQGQGEKDFVCERCLRLAGIRSIYSCRGCGKFGSLTKAAMVQLGLEQVGVIVVTEACASCGVEKLEKFKIYSVERQLRRKGLLV